MIKHGSSCEARRFCYFKPIFIIDDRVLGADCGVSPPNRCPEITLRKEKRNPGIAEKPGFVPKLPKFLLIQIVAATRFPGSAAIRLAIG